MRRVVVTGMGMVSPLGCGVENDMGASDPRRKWRVADRRRSRCPISPARSPAPSRAATAPTAPSILINGWSRRSNARSTDFIVFAMGAARQALDDAGWMPTAHEDQIRDRRDDRIRHRRHRRHRRYLDRAARQGSAQGFAVLHSGPSDQSRFGLCLDRVQPQGPEPCGRDGLFDRRCTRSATPVV